MPLYKLDTRKESKEVKFAFYNIEKLEKPKSKRVSKCLILSFPWILFNLNFITKELKLKRRIHLRGIKKEVNKTGKFN